MRISISASELAKIDKEYARIHAINSRIKRLTFEIEERKKRKEVENCEELVEIVEYINTLRWIGSRLVTISTKKQKDPIVENFFKYFPKTNREDVIMLFGYEIYHQSMSDRVEEKKKQWRLGKIRRSEYERALNKKIMVDQLNLKKIQIRKTEVENRIIDMIDRAINDEKYIIFNTLTVDVVNEKKVFEKGSKVWNEYIREIDKDQRKMEKKRGKITTKRNKHEYIAIAEEGEKTGNKHIHVIHVVKYIDKETDPNSATAVPVRREMDAFKQYWKYGISAPIAVRMSNVDPYGKLGWKWPKEKVNGVYVGIERTNKQILAKYLTKYILKAYQKRGEKEKWKMKLSQNKNQQMKKIVSQMSKEQIRKIIKSQQVKVRVRYKIISRTQIIREMMRQKKLKEYRQSLKDRLKICSMYNVQHQKNMIQRYDDMMKMQCSTKNIIQDIEIQELRNMVEYEMSEKPREEVESKITDR